MKIDIWSSLPNKKRGWTSHGAHEKKNQKQKGTHILVDVSKPTWIVGVTGCMR